MHYLPSALRFPFVHGLEMKHLRRTNICVESDPPWNWNPLMEETWTHIETEDVQGVQVQLTITEHMSSYRFDF